MLFHTTRFFIFLAVILVAFYTAPKPWRRPILLVASYYFYMCWIPKFILLLLFLTVIDYIAARWIASTDAPRYRKVALIVSLSANLGLLGFFKYYNFFASNIALLAGRPADSFAMSIILPLGISFHTFQSMSYVVDVYRREQAPIVNPIVAFSTFAAFRGQTPWLNMWTRLVLGYFVAVVAGLTVRQFKPESILRKGAVKIPSRKRLAFSVSPLPDGAMNGFEATVPQKLIAAVRMACDDFIDTAIYFMIGAGVAATFNTAVDQQIILPLALEPTLSTVSMMAIALVLTLCSTSDAFIAATFVSFPIFARMAFMVFGPMFDLKLFFLYSVLFKKRFVIGLGIGLFVLIGIICSRLLIYVYAGQAL